MTDEPGGKKEAGAAADPETKGWRKRLKEFFRKRYLSKNIMPVPLDDIDWTDIDDGLGKVFKWAVDEANGAVSYYLKKTKWNRRAGWGIRVAIGFLAAAAAILPIVSQLTINSSGESWLKPVWATLVAAVAAALYGLDRSVGWTNAWIRFIKTANTIHALLNDFCLEWNMALGPLMEKGLKAEDIPKMVKIAKDFIENVNKSIETETRAWISDYKKATAEFEVILEKQAGEKEGLEVSSIKPVKITDNDVHIIAVQDKARKCIILEGKAKIKVGDADYQEKGQGDSFDIPAGTGLEIQKSEGESFTYVLTGKE